MFIQYRVRLSLIYMRVALFKIRLLRKLVSNIRGPITSQNIGAAAPAPTHLALYIIGEQRALSFGLAYSKHSYLLQGTIVCR